MRYSEKVISQAVHIPIEKGSRVATTPEIEALLSFFSPSICILYTTDLHDIIIFSCTCNMSLHSCAAGGGGSGVSSGAGSNSRRETVRILVQGSHQLRVASNFVRHGGHTVHEALRAIDFVHYRR